MKLLKIENSQGFFRLGDGEFDTVDKLTKEHLLRLVSYVLDSDDDGDAEASEMDEYDETQLKNQAHQIIYRSVHRKLADLKARRKEFVDEAARLYLDDYEKYRGQGPEGEDADVDSGQ